MTAVRVLVQVSGYFLGTKNMNGCMLQYPGSPSLEIPKLLILKAESLSPKLVVSLNSTLSEKVSNPKRKSTMVPFCFGHTAIVFGAGLVNGTSNALHPEPNRQFAGSG